MFLALFPSDTNPAAVIFWATNEFACRQMMNRSAATNATPTHPQSAHPQTERDVTHTHLCSFAIYGMVYVGRECFRVCSIQIYLGLCNMSVISVTRLVGGWVAIGHFALSHQFAQCATTHGYLLVFVKRE